MPKSDDYDDEPKGKKKKKGGPAERRSTLDEQKKEEMLAILIRNEAAFDVVQDILKVSHVRQMSDYHALVWRTVRAYHRTHKALPARGSLMADLHNACKADEGILNEEELNQLDVFIDYAFDDKEHGKHVTRPNSPPARVAVDTCKQFLQEVATTELRDDLLKDGTVPTDLGEAIEAHRTKLDIVESLTDVEIDVPFPEGWDKRKQVQLFSCGVPPLDELMGGGWRGKEVVLFMGPYGSCKTTVACHGISQSLVTAHEQTAKKKTRLDKKGKPMTPVVVLIFTESDKDEYRCRLLSNLARVEWKRLSTMGELDDLSDSASPGAETETLYEKAEFKKDMKEDTLFFSEQERVIAATKIANKHLLMIDCTDSDDSPHQIGRGGIPEVANVIRSVFRKRKDAYPMCFWIDHVSALADRVAEADAELDDKLHLVLKRMPRQAADRIAKPWNAPVALLHQLSGEANSRRATAKFHHSDSAGSKSIGEYVNFAVVTGPVDDQGHCKWEATKHRRTPAMPLKVIKVEGQFNRVREDTDYTVDFGRQMIVPKKEMDALAKQKAAAGGGDYAGMVEV